MPATPGELPTLQCTNESASKVPTKASAGRRNASAPGCKGNRAPNLASLDSGAMPPVRCAYRHCALRASAAEMGIESNSTGVGCHQRSDARAPIPAANAGNRRFQRIPRPPPARRRCAKKTQSFRLLRLPSICHVGSSFQVERDPRHASIHSHRHLRGACPQADGERPETATGAGGSTLRAAPPAARCSTADCKPPCCGMPGSADDDDAGHTCRPERGQ